jgi:hypothetical protein
MTYSELIQLYFERSNALQWYWTLYVVVVGGLLAFSSLRQRPDRLTALLITVLFMFFAYKNLGAIHDVTLQRLAVQSDIKAHVSPDGTTTDLIRLRSSLEPTLAPPDYESVRNSHVASDILTVAAVWAMERRRRKAARAKIVPG